MVQDLLQSGVGITKGVNFFYNMWHALQSGTIRMQSLSSNKFKTFLILGFIWKTLRVLTSSCPLKLVP